MGKILFGADDAGRGPVIGPMVLAGVTIDENDLDKLKSIGVKDSKLLTARQREELYPQIIKIVKDYKIIITQPKDIDAAVNSQSSSLNFLEAQNFAELINSLKPNLAIIDCPSTNLKEYTLTLKSLLKVDSEIECHHKADLLFPTVSAASILAKVTRDKEIEKIQKNISEPIGSGYPSDPATKEFLKNNWDKYPEIFRHSWSTYYEYEKGKYSVKQKNLFDF